MDRPKFSQAPCRWRAFLVNQHKSCWEGCVCYLRNLSGCHRRPLLQALHHQHLHMESADFSFSGCLSCFTPSWYVKSWQGGLGFSLFSACIHILQLSLSPKVCGAVTQHRQTTITALAHACDWLRKDKKEQGSHSLSNSADGVLLSKAGCSGHFCKRAEGPSLGFIWKNNNY